MSTPHDRLKEGQRWMWSLGDYSRLAEALEPHAESLAEACNVWPGATVLDVAAGNGNFALAAVRRGATVTASDLTPQMVELGRVRSASSGSRIVWTEADAEDLPFADGAFDVVASVFGAMFAARPALVAAELFRVVRPGGLVAMANYGPSGFLPRLSDVISSFSARPALELPSPFQWGEEDEVRRRFSGLATSVEVTHHRLFFEAGSIDGLLEFWEETNPPQNALKTMLPPEVYGRMVDAERALVEEIDEGAGDLVRVGSSYIQVLARKSGG